MSARKAFKNPTIDASRSPRSIFQSTTRKSPRCPSSKLDRANSPDRIWLILCSGGDGMVQLWKDVLTCVG